MKTTLKRIITVILCAVIAITSTGINTAYAAQKLPLKVAFNGKSVTLIKDLIHLERDETAAIKTLEKKWRKPKKNNIDGQPVYIWKKGKTSIEISDHGVQDHGSEDGFIGSVRIEINDKNGAVYGVKVGMKKDAALKKLKKATGIKKVSNFTDDVNEWMNKTGIYSNDETISVNPATYMPVNFHLKNGKVSDIFWHRS